MKTWAVISNTFQESFRKFIFLTFSGLSTLVLLFFIIALNLDVVEGSLAAISLFGFDVGMNGEGPSVEEFVSTVEGAIAVAIFTAGLFLSLFATAGLLPSMLRKGYAELVLSKPMGRAHLLLSKYSGGLSIVLFQIAYLVCGSWVILSVKTGFWNIGYLLSVATIMVVFMNLYAIMFLLTLLLGNGWASLLITYFCWWLSPLLVMREQVYPLIKGAIFHRMLDFLYYAMPKNAEIVVATLNLVRGQGEVELLPIWLSLLTVVVYLTLSAMLFSRKDY